MVQGFIPNGSGGGRPPYKPPTGKPPIRGTPGLVTSTGGIIGTGQQLILPLFDLVSNKTYLELIDPEDNDCEEEAFYIFKQEDVMPSRVVSVHKLIVVYKELGTAKFSVGVQVYIRKANKFMQVSKEVKIVDRKDITAPFPDGKLRELPVDLVIEGERPQVFIRRKAKSGPLCITRVHMVGHADEKEVV